MGQSFPLLILALSLSLSCAADESLRLWPGQPPERLENMPREVVTEAGALCSVPVPALTVFATMAEKPAQVLNPLGVTVFGLNYLLRPPHQLDNAGIQALRLLDAKRAVQLVRARAAQWGINPHKVGITGYSAGANLAINMAANFDAGTAGSGDEIEVHYSRPDFAVGCVTWHWWQKNSPFKFGKDAPREWLASPPTSRF